MNDYERLGFFYLGRRHQTAAKTAAPEPVLYDSRDLTTHAVCVGMTGSGKTGLGISILEEAAMDGIPALCIDPKGDLGNLALRFPNLDAASFAPWIDPGEAARRDQSIEQRAAAVAAKWKEGLSEWDQTGERIRAFQQNAEIPVFTPGSVEGRPLSVLSSFDPPANQGEITDRAQTAASGLLGLLGIEADPLSREHVFLCALLERAWSNDQTLELAQMVREVSDPPVKQIGVMPVDTFFPPSDRQKLALQLNALVASHSFRAWQSGESLDVQKLLWSDAGQPRLSVLSIAHLSDAERMFFVTLLLGEVISWMRAQPGTTSLRALLYMDEVFGFLPPVASPPSKALLLTLLKQARAYGLGVVLSTQNPVDLDYKALSNCGTWLLGRLQTEQDVDRVLDGLKGVDAELDVPELRQNLAGLPGRVFLMRNVHESEPVFFHTRWVMSYLRGPLTLNQIASLNPNAAEPAAPTEPSASSPTVVRPAVPDEVEEIFLAPSPALATKPLVYEPAWFAHARSHYVLKRAGIDNWFEQAWLAPVTAGSASKLWEASTSDHPAKLHVTPAPADSVGFAELPRGALTAKRRRALKTALKAHVYRTAPMNVGYVRSLKAYSAVGESPGEFAARVQQKAREARDADLEKLREAYGKKLKRIRERIARAEERVAREKAQATKGSLDTVLSVGTTVLGAVLGRRTTAATTARRAASSLRKAGGVAKERRDVERAEDRVEDLQTDLETLETEFQEKVKTLQERHAMPVMESVTVRSRKTDFEIVRFALAWVPKEQPNQP